MEIRQNFTKQECSIAAADIPMFETPEDIYIDTNHSETRATVRTKADPIFGGLLCCNFAPEVLADTTIRLPTLPADDQ